MIVMLMLLVWVVGDLNLFCLFFVGLFLCVVYLLCVLVCMRLFIVWMVVLFIFVFMLGGWGLYVVYLKLGVLLVVLGGLSVVVSFVFGLWCWWWLDGVLMVLFVGWLV